eukprot:TRINITY_DN10087_c0_g1_i4.p1 TRINITY_DN10087_c0_g1~~TRINITY_DN10087_c0_g1_i4.p1  ORF type:complete len:828 (-),score=245.94 TRINITY_DN10087_c0_g1_i4:195-2648(-)
MEKRGKFKKRHDNKKNVNKMKQNTTDKKNPGEKHTWPSKGKKSDGLKQKISDLQAKYQQIDPGQVKKFSDFPLSPETLKGLKHLGFDQPTEIQRESLGLALRGLDILGAAKTGSGKTLAFIIPIIERLYTSQWTSEDGVGALIITPTRELAYQIFECLRVVGKYHDYSAGLVIGGKDLKYEWDRVVGCNIVVCTPGRLLQHLDENPSFSMDNLQMLILDEADRCLDLGFKAAMNAIIESLPAKRQTLLFSATQTRSVTDLARLSLDKPVYVSVHENSTNSTPDNLTQSYVVTDLQNKMDIIWSFLKNHKKKKILVFMQSCKQVKYVNEIFCRMRPGISVMALYGSLHQLRRMAIYDSFCTKEYAVLFATDIAARGLDFPAVDWVIQLDCPEDGVTYVHRAGRTARYNTAGESLLVLLPSEEQGMLKQLAAHKIPINKIEINPNKLSTVSKKMASYLASDNNLKDSAQRAFQSYLKSIYLMKNKAIFNVDELDLAKYAESLGLATTPRVRFLDRQRKLKENQSAKVKAKSIDNNSENQQNFIPVDTAKVEAKKPEAPKKITFATSSDDDDDESDNDDILTVKRTNVHLEHAEEDGADIDEDDKKSGALKVVTKAQVAKKLLKKKIVPNSKVVFGEEGQVLADSSKTKVSAEGREYEAEDGADGGGIDIEKVKQVLRAEDKFDREAQRKRAKELKKEKKRKEKEGRKRKQEEEEGDSEGEGDSDSGESVDLSWLPDPDKVYENKDEDISEDGNDASSSSEEEQETTTTTTIVKEKGASTTVIKKHIPKRRKLDASAGESLDTGLCLQDDEDLALQLLMK